MFLHVVRIEGNLHVKISITDVAYDHADQAAGIRDAFGLGNAIRQSRYRHAGVSGEALFARHKAHARPIHIVAGLPQFTAIFRFVSEAVITAAIVGGDRLHLLDLLAHVGVGTVELHKERWHRRQAFQLAVLDARLHLHIVQQLDTRHWNAQLHCGNHAIHRAVQIGKLTDGCADAFGHTI